MVPLRVQKIVLFMLQKGTKGYYVKLGGIFIGSIEGFATNIRSIRGMIYMHYTPAHLSLNRVLLLMLGLWPYEQSKLVPLQIGLLCGIIITFMLCQVKTLIDKMQDNFDKIRDENEIAILDEYTNKAKRYTTVSTVFVMCLIFALFLLQFWPTFLNIILPTNETRPIFILKFINLYFVDQEKHLYLFLLHSNAAICIGIFTTLGTGTMIISYGYHICGMFKIARFTELLISSFSLWCVLLIGMGVSCLSLNLMQIYLILSSGYDLGDLAVQLLFLCGMYLFMFLGNYIAQKITDYNNDVFDTVYNIQWYMVPLRVQKIILFMLQKGTKGYYVKLGGIFIGSIEGFATLLSATISYFTVIYSTRQ
ncbi:PREDICTED: uncharacterized protein LOC106751365 [Dinoponera quadriceps]|uniref:Odorant receptor n=1 Tax=Dinoponera quadriceps TaxID=609295 RepID=A0A6P3YCW4_DINQU|nr:PREDICTED: uncharacterized protein LOC106751365 [Dinoponera quadriceps]